MDGVGTREATVIRGINNIYTVRFDDGGQSLCRIKGKQLGGTAGEYNPIACGERVSATDDGMIIDRLPRKSTFTRWNSKGLANQAIAVNMDQVCLVSAIRNPPFRPRFLDRAIACVQGCPVLIVLTKTDLGEPDAPTEERLALYEKLGYRLVRLSALTGDGIESFVSLLKGKTTVFAGESGVGKSTLINRIAGSNQKTGRVSEKYDRGRHTTTCSLLLDGPGFSVIDTPGVRELFPPHVDARILAESFPEFRGVECAYDGCLHRDEPGCGVKKRVEEGVINADRYASWLHILDSMDAQNPAWLKKEKKMPKKGEKYRNWDGDAE